MTNPTPPVSDVLRGIETLASQSRGMLEQALELIEKAARAEEIAMETAIAALGEAHGRTVVELARMPVASEMQDMLRSIRDAAAGMLGEIAAPAPSATHHRTLAHPAAIPQTDASGKVEMFGIPVPASRLQEAEEVVAAAKTAVAQNRKANPYDHYRGKNSWCKSLFLAAFSRISTDQATDSPSSEASPDERASQRPQTPPAAPEVRPSIAASGPVRGAGSLREDPAPRPASPVQPPPRPPVVAQPRQHAHGATAQTIPDEVLQRSATPTPARPTTRFFNHRTR
jgi:hypothetical protein